MREEKNNRSTLTAEVVSLCVEMPGVFCLHANEVRGMDAR